MQRNVGGAERGPEVVALLAEPVGRGPRLAEKLAHCDPVVLASNCDQRGQMQRAPCRQVLRIGGRQPGLQGSRCGHRDAGGLLDVTGPEEDVPKVVALAASSSGSSADCAAGRERSAATQAGSVSPTLVSVLAVMW